MLRIDFRASLLFLGLFLALTQQQAQAVIVLNFEGLRDLEPINGFYNGGTGGSGSVGTNYGVEFSTNALAIIDADAGGTGNFGGEPSPSTVLFFLNGNPFMNVAAGFDTGFSLFYSAINNPGNLSVFSGVNGTGNLLASLNLPLTPFNGMPDPTGLFSPFVPIGVAFNGVARSIQFGGVQDQIGFDDITFGSVTPGGVIPEPSSIAAFAGLFGLSFFPIRRRSSTR